MSYPHSSIPSSSRNHIQSQTQTNSARSSISLMSRSTNTSLDEEKWIPSPVPTLAATRSLFGSTIRKRRILGVIGFVLVLLGLSGWYVGGLPVLDDMWDGVGGTPLSIEPELGFEETTTKPYIPNGVPVLPSVNLKTWGLSTHPASLLQGLIPWPTRPRYSETDEPLSPLGKVADEVYNLGYWELPETAAQLDTFISEAFPEKMQGQLKFGIARYLAGVGNTDAWDKEKKIWQTDKDRNKEGGGDVATWKSGKGQAEGWEWEMVPEGEADAWVLKHFSGSRIHQMWSLLPSGILRSDTLRYLLLLVNGGIYTDTDTRLRKPPSKWGQGATLWANGKGLKKADRDRIEAGEAWQDVLGEASVVIGIEADVGGREDWHEWWPRPIQIVQWTIASAPHHPILLSSLLRILHSTQKAVEWQHTHVKTLQSLKDAGKGGKKVYEETERINVLDEPNMGGPVGVMDWTGPGLFTDAVLGYLNVHYGLVWTDLKDLQVPLRVGDVVILPVTGFSPGVGNFGAKAPSHPQAMVEHKFAGSWRKAKERKD